MAGYVYGDASTFHVYVEAAPGSGRPAGALRHAGRGDPQVDPRVRGGRDPERLRARGVELMSYTGGVTSAAHSEADVAETVAVFDDLVGDLGGGLLARTG